jgi:predicted alpha/beta-hydrolase family hydrolase
MRGSAARDQQGVERAVESMKKIVQGRVFAGGHSYGGRQTTNLAATNVDLVSGLLLLSYPLHPPLKPDQMRTAHFPDLRTPALFVHGSRDGFGSLDEMTEALKLIPATTKLLPITGSGHELLSKKNQNETMKQIVDAFQLTFDASEK